MSTSVEGDQPGMRQHDADEQRFLLTGRTNGSGTVLSKVDHPNIRTMRPGQRAADFAIGGA